MCVAFRDCDALVLAENNSNYAALCYLRLHDPDSLISYVSRKLRWRYRNGYYVYRLNGDRLAYDDIPLYVRRLVRRLFRRRYNNDAIVARLAFVYGYR